MVGTGQHFQRNLAPAIYKLEKNGLAKLAATVDVLGRSDKNYFEDVIHIKRNNKPIHEQLAKFKKEDHLIILGHTNALHAKDALDLLRHGFRVAIEKPYTLDAGSLERVMTAGKKNRPALLEYYLTMKSAALLVGYGAVNKKSFYFTESLIKPLLALGDFAGSVGGFTGMLPKLVGTVMRVEVEVLEGEGDTGTLEGRGADLVDIKSGGGMLQDLGTHALSPLVALEKIIGTLPGKGGFTVRTARSSEYMQMAKRRFALPKKQIGETYAEFSCTTAKKVAVTVRVGKYVFGDRNRRGILISGSKGEAYLDLNSCTLSVNDKPVLGIEKSYYPVVRSVLAQTRGEPLFTFDPAKVAAKAQSLVFDIQKRAAENKEDVYYESGAEPENIFVPVAAEAKDKLNEEDIRPEDSHNRWLEILGKEVSKFFPPKKRKGVVCPGCHSAEVESEFIKLGFIYKWCKNCFSLYASPRPSEQEIDEFYRSSKAMKFYGDSIFKPTIETRHEHQITPLLNWLKSIIPEYAPNAVRVLDFMPKYYSVWAEFPGTEKKVSLVEPVHIYKTPAGSKTVKFSTAKSQTYDLITAFDVLDHRSDPERTVKDLSKMCAKGGVVLMTLNSGSGFEYQALGRDSHRLVPPSRLNLMTIEVVEDMLVKNGFELIDVSTPGKLDVDIVLKGFLEDESMPIPRFVSYMLKKRGAMAWESFQDFLQLNNLSSFMRIAARKK